MSQREIDKGNLPSCGCGNQIWEWPLEWGPLRKGGEDGEEGGPEWWDGGEPRLLARKVPMNEAEEFAISPVPAGQRQAETDRMRQ